MQTDEWRDHIFLTRDLTAMDERSAFYTRARRGEFVQLFRGAFVLASEWRRLDSDGRYRSRIKAAAAVRPTIVASHDSAAALWRLPAVDGWPNLVHILAPTTR